MTAEDLARVRTLDPILVPSSFGVIPHEERRNAARIASFIQTGRQNEAVRNTIADIRESHPDRFDVICELLTQHFGVSLREPVFDPSSDQFIDSRYGEGNADLDLFSAGSGLIQVLQLLTFSLNGDHGMILLDEPDAHLHSSMQLIIIEVLERLARDFNYQVLISTHSKEIINFVDPSMLIPVSSGVEVGPLEPHASAVAVLEELGAIDNIDLYSLFTSKRCCFVEGKTDRRVLQRIAARIGSTVFEGDSRVVVIKSGGVDNNSAAGAVALFSELAGVDLAHFALRDRDGLTDEHRESIATDDYLVHELDCIESYLILPEAWERAIAKVWKSEECEGQPPTANELTDLVSSCADELANDTLDHVALAVDKHVSKTERRYLTPPQINELARAAIEASQATLQHRLRLVPGKRLLARCRDEIKSRYNTSLSDAAIIEFASDAELDALISLVRRCESLG
jgi:hypothetical protein